MGGDTAAPTAKMPDVAEGDRLSGVLGKAAAYLPRVSGAALLL